MKLAKMSFIIFTVIPGMAHAQNENLKVVSGTAAHTALSKLSGNSVAEKALKGKLGECKALKNSVAGTSYAYSLNYKVNGTTVTERFGHAEVPRYFHQGSWNWAGLHGFRTNITRFRVPQFSAAQLTSAKNQMATKLQTLLTENKCGSIDLEVYNNKITDLKNSVKFYLSADKKLTCTSDRFAKKIRQPDSCEYKSVSKPLPSKLCNFLYQTATLKAGGRVTASTATSSTTTTTTNSYSEALSKARALAGMYKMAPARFRADYRPAYEVITPELQQDWELAARFDENPELHIATEAAVLHDADHYIPTRVFELVERMDISPDTFDKLPIADQGEVANLVATHMTYDGDSKYRPFSERINNVAVRMRAKVLAWQALKGAKWQPEIFPLPETFQLNEFMDERIKPINKFSAIRKYKYDMNCMSEYIKPSHHWSSTKYWQDIDLNYAEAPGSYFGASSWEQDQLDVRRPWLKEFNLNELRRPASVIAPAPTEYWGDVQEWSAPVDQRMVPREY